jgi:DNA-binding NtrC family response regulator
MITAFHDMESTIEAMRLGAYDYIHKPIAATNRNLDDLAQQGKFRHDLLFRLKVISLSVPPLRDSIEDIPELVRYFLSRINRDLGSKVTRVENTVMNILKAYSWPGNVRELKNVLTKAILASRGSVLLDDAVQSVLTASGAEPLDSLGHASLDEVEKIHIKKAMTETHGNLSAAARMLGISRPTPRKRLKRYDLYSLDAYPQLYWKKCFLPWKQSFHSYPQNSSSSYQSHVEYSHYSRELKVIPQVASVRHAPCLKTYVRLKV